MKASELIEQLQRQIAAYGDLPVCLPAYIHTTRIDRVIDRVAIADCLTTADNRHYPRSIPHFSLHA